jgi:hypothetical protein
MSNLKGYAGETVGSSRLAGQDRTMLRHALSCAIKWNESLIEAHTPTHRYRGMGKNTHYNYIRRWRGQIRAWRRLAANPLLGGIGGHNVKWNHD